MAIYKNKSNVVLKRGCKQCSGVVLVWVQEKLKFLWKLQKCSRAAVWTHLIKKAASNNSFSFSHFCKVVSANYFVSALKFPWYSALCLGWLPLLLAMCYKQSKKNLIPFHFTSGLWKTELKKKKRTLKSWMIWQLLRVLLMCKPHSGLQIL